MRAQSTEDNSAGPVYFPAADDPPAPEGTSFLNETSLSQLAVNQEVPVDQKQEFALAVYLPLSLRDAISAALADSSVVRTLDGDVNVASITPTDVMIAAQQIAVEQGRFQPRLTGNLGASRIDDPPNTFFGPGITTNTRRDAANAMARVTQPLATGGSLSVGIEPATAYLFFPNGVNPGQFNPLYSTDVVIRARSLYFRARGGA